MDPAQLAVQQVPSPLADTGYPEDEVPPAIIKGIHRFDVKHKRHAKAADALMRSLTSDKTSRQHLHAFDQTLNELRTADARAAPRSESLTAALALRQAEPLLRGQAVRPVLQGAGPAHRRATGRLHQP